MESRNHYQATPCVIRRRSFPLSSNNEVRASTDWLISWHSETQAQNCGQTDRRRNINPGVLSLRHSITYHTLNHCRVGFTKTMSSFVVYKNYLFAGWEINCIFINQLKTHIAYNTCLNHMTLQVPGCHIN